MAQTPDIFLSYNREDQARAKLFADAFAEEGFDVWWDVGLRTGEAYDEVTETALRTAKAVVVLWSTRSVQSRWVRAEATIADRCKTLVPVMIEPCERPIMFELTQTAELSHWTGDAADKAWQAFLSDVRGFVGREASAPAPIALKSPKKVTASRRGIILAGGGAAVVAAASGGIAAWRWGMFEAAGIRNSVAVLPFKNLSGDPGQDYFSEGLAEEIRSALARNPLLKVIATASAATFRDRTLPVPEIAKQLGVSYVLDGSVRREGALVRIAVQLVNGKDGVTGWSRTFEEPFKDLFPMQARIAQIASDVLTAQVTDRGVGEGRTDFSDNGGTSNAEAFEAYLQGVAIFDRGRMSDNFLAEYSKSIPHFDRAIALDPSYAAAYGGRARAFNQLGAGPTTNVESLRQGLQDAQKCIDLAPQFSDGYVVKGFCWIFFKLNVSGADQFYERARSLGWGDAKTLIGYVGYASNWWKFKEADEAIQRLIALDPLSRIVQMRLVQLRLSQRRFQDVLDLAARLIKQESDYLGLNEYIAEAYRGLKNLVKAREYVTRMADGLSKDAQFASLALDDGNFQDYANRWASIAVEYGDQVNVSMAGFYANSGDRERAIALLEKSYKLHDTALLYMRHDDVFDAKMSDHPRYVALVKKLGLTGKPG